MKRHLSIFASFGILGCQGSAISTQTETEVRALTVEVSALKADVERLEDQVEANRISAVNWEDDVEALWSVVSENESRLDDVEATEHVTEDWVTESIVAKTGSLGELATRLDELEEASSTSETAALAEKIQVNADGDVIFRDTNVYIQNGTGSTDELN